jgi:CRP-like cAMP-binding protein
MSLKTHDAGGRRASGPAGLACVPGDRFLDPPWNKTAAVRYGPGETIFSQGEACDDVFYIRCGGVKLSVRSKTGREAVVAIAGPGDCCGEGALAGQLVRTGSATAITPSEILPIAWDRMAQLLRKSRAVSDWFIAQMLARSIRIEEDLIDQRFNSSEKRLARALLLLGRHGQTGRPAQVVPAVSPATLAETVGAPPARVAGLLKKFRRLGFIACNGGKRFRINDSRLGILLQD